MYYLYKELVDKARKGDKRAMEDLLDKLKPLIYSAIRRFSKGVDTEDLYQEACVILLESVRDFDEERKVPFLAFAKSRIHYGIHNLTRKNTYELSLDEPLWEGDGQTRLDQLEDTGDAIEDRIARIELVKSLKNAMECLTQKQREVILDHYFGGKKLKEIAVDRGVHYKTVLGLKSRAISELYKHLKGIV
ncbi:MAG: sigma-70 family RNA polymerase sigma factor [Clostridiales bacterium]|nr:sigma-70 family RNA polymerase sigma factor [Clostridiales bacterium]